MNDIHRHNDFPPLIIERIRDLAAAAREDFGLGLSRDGFTDKLLLLLEDMPGCESGEVPTSLIESAWAEYCGRRVES